MSIIHPDYSTLASRIAITALHKHTYDDIREVAKVLYNYVDVQGRPASLLDTQVYEVIMKFGD